MKKITRNSPPVWLDKVLSLLISERVADVLIGDLHELYRKRCEHRGQWVADLCYLRDALDLCRPFAIRRHYYLNFFNLYMFRNYVKSTWRNLARTKLYSSINLGGLTMGLAVGILILIWVQNELSFDHAHRKANDIYRLEIFGGTGESLQLFKQEVAPIGPLSKQLSAVIEQVRITDNSFASLYQCNEKIFTDLRAVFVDPSFFTVFDFPLIKGSISKPFIDDNSVIITEKTARKFFGDQDPVGGVIKTDRNLLLTVSGVVKDFSTNSSINYDMLMPMSYNENKNKGTHFDLNTNFTHYAYDTYLLLKPGVDVQELAKQITGIHLKYKPEDTDGAYTLMPLTKMHLYSADGHDEGIQTVKIFIAVAILILTIACINYVNLSTARAMRRSTDVSMRKIFGASPGNLFLQFVIETAILFAIAAALCFGVIYLLMPFFNQLSGKQLSFNLLDYHVWSVLFITIVSTLLASSIYPALLLSSIKPLQVLKGKISPGLGDALFRKILVVTQFSLAIILIIGTIVITSQLDYIRSKELGYDKSIYFHFRCEAWPDTMMR